MTTRLPFAASAALTGLGDSGHASPNSVVSIRVASGSLSPIVIMPPLMSHEPRPVDGRARLGYDDRVTALARSIRTGLTVLLAAGCASTNVAADPSAVAGEPSIDTQLAQAAAFRASNHRDAAL